MSIVLSSIKSVFQHRIFPILFLLAISLLAGLFTFQDYGMAWDEYLYYEYADAIGYAYSIPAHLSPDFDLEKAYGPSAGDHRNHGPGYIIFARLGVYALQALTDIDKIALWHLVNFATYLVGTFFVYKIALRWLHPYTALASTVLYLTQPVLWGHAFINPKDMPFATAFIAAVYFGFRTVDGFASPEFKNKKNWPEIVVTGILIGLATNMRIIGPLLSVMLFMYALFLRQRKNLLWFIPVGVIAVITMYITWPYIWETPIATFIEVLKLMSSYSTMPKMIFMGDFYRSYDLPLRYLPWLLGITLTEPVWPLFVTGLAVAGFRIFKKSLEWKGFSILLFWFISMLFYVLILRPSIYDGYRHFLFILPPVFIVCGFAFEEIYHHLSAKWLYGLLALIFVLPGISADIKLHPYQYAYYNTFVGGTKNVAGIYETDYWLTCYKEAVEQFNQIAPDNATLAVIREPANAAYYLKEGIQVTGYTSRQPGDYLLLGSRLNDYARVLPQYPTVLSVERDGATFCEIELVQ